MSRSEKIVLQDSEPVAYCSRCYSLAIKYEEAIGSDCCQECGCSDISETAIEKWEEMYERRYGHKYITSSRNIRNSPVFKMSLSELKMKVYEHSEWRNIVKRFYPRFPEGLSRADSVILLFDKLAKDGRMDELKEFLFNNP